MAINNVQWANEDLITETKLDQMVADETNTADNIHPQYWDGMNVGSLINGFYTAKNISGDDSSFIGIGFGVIAITSNVTHASSLTFETASLSFKRGITTEIDIDSAVKVTDVTGMIASNTLFSVVVERFSATTGSSLGVITTTPNQSGTTAGAAFANGSAISISAASTDDIIRLTFRVRINETLVGSNDKMTGNWIHPNFTRTKPKL